VNLRTPLLALSALLLLSGCHAPTAGPSTEESRLQQRAELATQREQLDMIPPPTKSRYMAIRSFDSWENPYLTVQSNMLELHVTIADANPSPIGVGGMLRPIGARRQELDISLDKLGEAMSAIPDSAWPYGRVVAIEEAHNTPASAEHDVRRTMEDTISRLNDLGIVVYDLNLGSLR
jgi:hypothetical protein